MAFKNKKDEEVFFFRFSYELIAIKDNSELEKNFRDIYCPPELAL